MWDLILLILDNRLSIYFDFKKSFHVSDIPLFGKELLIRLPVHLCMSFLNVYEFVCVLLSLLFSRVKCGI